MKPKTLVWIRRISQTLFLGLFLFLLVETRLPQDVYLDYSLAFTNEQNIRLDYPITFFFQLDPLTWLTSLISGYKWIKNFYWALGLIFATLLLGRIFCGFICPLGTINHMVSWFRPALKGERMIQANQKASSQLSA